MSENAESPISETDLQTFLDAWVTFQHAAGRGGNRSSTELRDRIAQHLGTEPSELESATTTLLDSDAVNQDLAFEAFDPHAEVLGLDPNIARMGQSVGLQMLMIDQPFIPNQIMPITWVDHPVDVDTKRSCPAAALWLLTTDTGPAVAGMWQKESHGPSGSGGLHLEVLATEADSAQQTLRTFEQLRAKHNVYRGKVLGFSFTEYGEFGLEFVSPSKVSREQLILPDADLATIERHTIGLSARAEELRDRGRHLKRGLLLYGPPGTGKTHTVSYLVGAMPDRTTIILQGPSAGAIGMAAAIARAFPPATIVIEDVDLIAYDRGMGMGDNPMLFQLLNEMDGFADDSDLLFVLTTNRADVLEPALAARPGRIDQAIEVAKPDHGARIQLLHLYLMGIEHSVTDLDAASDALDGVTASFIKELCRRALMNSLDDELPLDDDLLSATIAELLERSAPVMHSSLGAREAPTAPGFDHPDQSVYGMDEPGMPPEGF